MLIPTWIDSVCVCDAVQCVCVISKKHMTNVSLIWMDKKTHWKLVISLTWLVCKTELVCLKVFACFFCLLYCPYCDSRTLLLCCTVAMSTDGGSMEHKCCAQETWSQRAGQGTHRRWHFSHDRCLFRWKQVRLICYKSIECWKHDFL